MTVEQQIRDLFDSEIGRVEITDVRSVRITHGNAIRRRHPIVVAISVAAAVTLVVAGLIAIGRTRNDNTASDSDDAASLPDAISTAPPHPAGSVVATEAPDTSATTSSPPLSPTTTQFPATRVGYGVEAFFALLGQLSSARAISFEAIDQAVQHCMSEHGLDDVATPTVLAAGFDATEHDLPWSFPTEQQAASTGYLPTSSEPNIVEVQPPATGTPEADAMYGDVIGSWQANAGATPPGFPLGGDIYNGCLPTAQIHIIGNDDPEAAFRINDYDYRLREVLNLALRSVADAPEFIAAQAAWITCMNAAGYDTTGVEEFSHRTWPSPRPSATEIAAATTDAACGVSTGVRAVGQRLFDHEITTWFDANPNDYQEIMDFVEGVHERSNATIADGS